MKKDTLLKSFTKHQLQKQSGKPDQTYQINKVSPIDSGMLCMIRGGNNNDPVTSDKTN